MPKLEPYRKSLAYSYAPGIFPSHTLLDMRPEMARRLLVHSTAQASEGASSLASKAQVLGIRTEIADHALARISRKENCFAAVVFEKYVDVLDAQNPHVVLHHPADMGNLGTILRTCLGFGLCDLAIIAPAADVFDPRVVRASMGALFALRIAYFDDFDTYRAQYPAHALYPFMLDGAMPLQTAAKTHEAPYALVFGNEASGLPATFAALGQPVRIMHSDKIDSLNLAVAVSIAAYVFTECAYEREDRS